MPARERVQAFIDAVVGGDHVQAIVDYYHEDASMQENLAPPRRGRELLVQHEAEALQKVHGMHTHPVTTFLVDGDNAVIYWIFDVTDANGQVRRLEELSLQRWRGDRILTEQFFYDSRKAWYVVEN